MGINFRTHSFVQPNAAKNTKKNLPFKALLVTCYEDEFTPGHYLGSSLFEDNPDVTLCHNYNLERKGYIQFIAQGLDPETEKKWVETPMGTPFQYGPEIKQITDEEMKIILEKWTHQKLAKKNPEKSIPNNNKPLLTELSQHCEKLKKEDIDTERVLDTEFSEVNIEPEKSNPDHKKISNYTWERFKEKSK